MKKIHSTSADQSISTKKSRLLSGLSAHDVNQYGLLEEKQKAVIPKNERVKVLYLGPSTFREGVWENRVKYIFPDLFEPLLEDCEIHMMTGEVPDFAKSGIELLQQKYGVHFYELPMCQAGIDLYSHWIDSGKKCAESIGAKVVTNVFGGAVFIYAVAHVARSLNIVGIVRVAGDDIASKVAMGKCDDESKAFFLERRKELIGLNMADRVLVMSPWEQQRVQEVCCEKEKVKIANRGVDLSRFKPAKIGIDKVPSRFLFIGRKSLEKGFDIIEAAADILEESHPEIEFWFAGNFEKTYKGNKTYLGFTKTEELPSLYESVDAFILTSRTEGMPQAVMEAMAMGKPCIVSKNLFQTIFEDGKDALLTELDPSYLSEQIVKLHQDIILADRLSKNSRKYAEKHFDKEILKEVYRHIFIDYIRNMN